jgi:hypothetical protein
MLDHEMPIVSERSAELLASLPELLVGFDTDAEWVHTPVGHWLARTKSFWRLGGQGPAFEEMRRLIPRAGGSYEFCAGSSARIDLLVLDGELSPEQDSPAHWTASLASDAVVMIVGIHPAAGASVLWRRWCEAQPAPAVFRVAAGDGLGILVPAPQSGPVVIRELIEADPYIAALFDVFEFAAEQRRAAFRQADAMRKIASQERVRADALVRQISLLESSPLRLLIWYLIRVTRRIVRGYVLVAFRARSVVLRRAVSWLLPRLQTFIRRLVKAARFAVRGELLAAIRARREFLRRNADAHL